MSAEVQDLQLVLLFLCCIVPASHGNVPAMASSGSKPSGATEPELSSSAGLLWSAIFTHTHDKDLRAQYAAEDKQKLAVVSLPAKASSASKPFGASLRTNEN